MTERQRVRLERTYRADIQDVWDLWTTKEGIELRSILPRWRS
jgi:uncharacterized protein YndB with AHSA1/START domain